jgi:predicted Zn-dependent protease
MGEPAPPLKKIHALRAAAASGRADVLRGALADMPPTLARVGRALLAADRGAWKDVVELLAGVAGVPSALDGLVSLALTRALTHTGQLEVAEQVANDRLKRVPDDLDVRTARARAWFAAGLVQQAADEYAAVLNRVPRHPGACLGLGELALATGNLAKASDCLQAACQSAPLATEPVVALARLFLVAGMPADGARQVEALIEVRPHGHDPRLTSSLAELRVAAGMFADVPPLLEQLEQLPELDDARRIERARLWAETGHSGPIRRLAESADSPGIVALLKAVADGLDGDDPLPGLDDAAVMLPNHWWVHERRAHVLMQVGDDVGASAAAAVALRLAPRAAAVRVTAAAALLREREDARSMRILRVASKHTGLWPSVRAVAQAALAENPAALAEAPASLVDN